MTQPGEKTQSREKTPNRVFYKPELDLLRFCAFLMVFFHHALPYEKGLLKNCMEAGGFGVGIFFCSAPISSPNC